MGGKYAHLKKIVNIKFKEIYNDQEISTKLSERSLKKLIFNIYRNNLFSKIFQAEKCMNSQMELAWEAHLDWY